MTALILITTTPISVAFGNNVFRFRVTSFGLCKRYAIYFDAGAGKTIWMQAIIFDLDGTLWDTVSLCVRAWNEAILARGNLLPLLEDKDLAGIMGLTREET